MLENATKRRAREKPPPRRIARHFIVRLLFASALLSCSFLSRRTLPARRPVTFSFLSLFLPRWRGPCLRSFSAVSSASAGRIASRTKRKMKLGSSEAQAKLRRAFRPLGESATAAQLGLARFFRQRQRDGNAALCRRRSSTRAPAARGDCCSWRFLKSFFLLFCVVLRSLLDSALPFLYRSSLHSARRSFRRVLRRARHCSAAAVGCSVLATRTWRCACVRVGVLCAAACDLSTCVRAERKRERLELRYE